jgi:hypothetical protein
MRAEALARVRLWEYIEANAVDVCNFMDYESLTRATRVMWRITKIR